MSTPRDYRSTSAVWSYASTHHCRGQTMPSRVPRGPSPSRPGRLHHHGSPRAARRFRSSTATAPSSDNRSCGQCHQSGVGIRPRAHRLGRGLPGSRAALWGEVGGGWRRGRRKRTRTGRALRGGSRLPVAPVQRDDDPSAGPLIRLGRRVTSSSRTWRDPRPRSSRRTRRPERVTTLALVHTRPPDQNCGSIASPPRSEPDRPGRTAGRPRATRQQAADRRTRHRP